MHPRNCGIGAIALLLAGCGGGGDDTAVSSSPRTCSSFTYQEDAQEWHQANRGISQ
jgi:hypothetical protein